MHQHSKQFAPLWFHVPAAAARLPLQVGRLAELNPAYVAPALRRHLLQLLNDMVSAGMCVQLGVLGAIRCYRRGSSSAVLAAARHTCTRGGPWHLQEHSPDSKHREESAALLDCLISSAPRLIQPYVSPINKALVSKLKVGIGLAAGQTLSTWSVGCVMDVNSSQHLCLVALQAASPASMSPANGPGAAGGIVPMLTSGAVGGNANAAGAKEAVKVRVEGRVQPGRSSAWSAEHALTQRAHHALHGADHACCLL